MAERLHVLSLVDEFVIGYAMRENIDWTGRLRRMSRPPGARWRASSSSASCTAASSRIERLMHEELEEPDSAAATLSVMEIIDDPDRFEPGSSSCSTASRSRSSALGPRRETAREAEGQGRSVASLSEPRR